MPTVYAIHYKKTVGIGGVRIAVFSLAFSVFIYAAFLPIVLQFEAVKSLQFAAAATCLIIAATSLKYNFYNNIFFLLAIIGIIAATSASVYFGRLNSHDLSKYSNFLLILFFCAISGAYVLESDRKYMFVKIFAYSSLMFSIIVFLAVYGKSESGRLGQGIGNPIWIARMSSVFLVYVISLKFFRKATLIHYCLGVVALGIMLATGSRGPILSLVVFLLLLNVFINNTARGLLKGALFASLAILMFTIFAPQSVMERFEVIFAFVNNDRLLLYREALALLNDSMLGYGVGGFQRETGLPDSLAYPHNLILEILVEYGVFVFVALIPLFFVSVKYAANNAKNGVEIAFMAGLLVTGFANSMFSGDITSPKELYVGSFFFIAMFINRYIKSKAS